MESIEGLDPFAAVKIFDGLFVANVFGARDIEFIATNKIRLFVNCSPMDVPCFFNPKEVDYLCVDWGDSEDQVI
jgi:hypothetical protein